MKANIICFLKGSGGNFLARVLSLDTTTVPLGGIVDDSQVDLQQRLERYDYTKFLDMNFSQMQSNGLSNWVDQELTHLCFPLAMGFEKLAKLNLDIVEPIHPEHFEEKISYFGQDHELTFVYLDPTNCVDWIVDQRYHKGVVLQNTPRSSALALTLANIDQLNSLRKKYNFIYSINLENILMSESTFLDEYKKTCDVFGLTVHEECALQIYRSWKLTWKNA
jgi:hypothetical protein